MQRVEICQWSRKMSGAPSCATQSKRAWCVFHVECARCTKVRPHASRPSLTHTHTHTRTRYTLMKLQHTNLAAAHHPHQSDPVHGQDEHTCTSSELRCCVVSKCTHCAQVLSAQQSLGCTACLYKRVQTTHLVFICTICTHTISR